LIRILLFPHSWGRCMQRCCCETCEKYISEFLHETTTLLQNAGGQRPAKHLKRSTVTQQQQTHCGLWHSQCVLS